MTIRCNPFVLLIVELNKYINVSLLLDYIDSYFPRTKNIYVDWLKNPF